MPTLSRLFAAGLACMAFQGNAGNTACPGFEFTDVASAAGLGFVHEDLPPATLANFMGGGVAAGDYNNDGWIDLYIVRGNSGANLLLRNLGDGTFEDVAGNAGVGIDGIAGSGPTFLDLDGDGWLDLIIGRMSAGSPWLYRNRGDGTFEDRSSNSGLPSFERVFSIAGGDVDLDGDLDLFFSQWNAAASDPVWLNDGGFSFRSGTEHVLGIGNEDLIRTFTPNFAHLDDDGWPDLAVASDFDNSQVFLSNGDGTLRIATDPAVIVDQNGMGAAIGDYDNDGDMDWFVTSILNADDPLYQLGNRLYQNDGSGTFSDVTDAAGVAHGHWGWGACFADFNNDGRLDLFHVNGWRDPPYLTDPARLFLQSPDQTFSEQAAACGVDDTGNGRGVVCFDFDRDGDVDIYVANNSGAPLLYRNDGGNSLGDSVEVQLRHEGANAYGVGARIFLDAGDLPQLREIQAASNYVSQNPAVALFGVRKIGDMTRMRVVWPDQNESRILGAPASDALTIHSTLIVRAGFE